MTLEIALFMVTAVVLPLVLTEFGDWCPWLAKRVISWTAHRLGDADATARYEEEWLAQLPEMPGRLSQLFTALGHLINLPRARRALRRRPPPESTTARRKLAGRVLPIETSATSPAAENYVLQLIARAQKGDITAFEHIYDRYNDAVHQYIYFRVGDPEIAENLTSETFLRALRRINSIWSGRDFDIWLLGIAKKLITDQFTSGHYRLGLPTTVFDGDLNAHEVEAMIGERLINVTLLNAVRSLDADHQECIVLRFLQGLSISETARAMKKSEAETKALQNRAVKRLSRTLPERFSG